MAQTSRCSSFPSTQAAAGHITAAACWFPRPAQRSHSAADRLGDRRFSGTHPLNPAIRNGTRGPEMGGRITIGDDCWFGGSVCVLPGVTIGRGVTVGAGSVVTKVRTAFSESECPRWLSLTLQALSRTYLPLLLLPAIRHAFYARSNRSWRWSTSKSTRRRSFSRRANRPRVRLLEPQLALQRDT